MQNPAPKLEVVLTPASYTNGATAAGNLDRQGFDFATIAIAASTSDAATNNFSTLKLAESDETDTTTFADITAFVGDGTGGFTIPNAVTTGDQLWQFDVDLRARKRYLRLSVTPLTTQVLSAVALLFKADETPVAAAGNVKALVQG